MDIHIYPHSIEYLCHCLPVRAARRKERRFIDLKTSLTLFCSVFVFVSVSRFGVGSAGKGRDLYYGLEEGGRVAFMSSTSVHGDC